MDNRVTIVMLAFRFRAFLGAESVLPHTGISSGVGRARRSGRRGDALATGSGRVRDRLFEASTYLTRVRPEDIPDEDLRRTFIGVMEDD